MSKPWQEFENDICELFPDTHKTAGSGNKTEKGDIVSRGERFDFLIEAKATSAKSFSVSEKLLAKVEGEALDRDADLRPMMAVRLQADNMHQGRNVVVIGLDDFLEILDATHE